MAKREGTTFYPRPTTHRPEMQHMLQGRLTRRQGFKSCTTRRVRILSVSIEAEVIVRSFFRNICAVERNARAGSPPRTG